MNNTTIGGPDPRTGGVFAYYETVGGGMGAGPTGPGLSGVHVHMSNSLNTPIEALEHAYPLRVAHYAIRRDTGGVMPTLFPISPDSITIAGRSGPAAADARSR